jgi:hypothetical protein
MEEKEQRRLSTPWRVVAIMLLVLVVAGCGGGKSGGAETTTTTVTAAPIGPVGMSASGLLAFARALGGSVYWIGPAAGFTYEVTRTRAGNVFVRYLPHGVHAGDKRAAFTVVGTYPYKDALATLKAVPHGKIDNVAGGGVVLSTTADPKSVHVAYPGADYEIEVYDPTPGRARLIALSGKLRTVG